MPISSLQRAQRRKHFLQLLPLGLVLVAIVAGVLNIRAIRTFLIGASGDPANIIVDTQGVIGLMPRPWRNLAQGGEDHNWRIQPILGQVKQLNPEYIRIDHLYDFYEIVSRDGGGLSFNWSKIDLVVSDILATGAKPYFSLSYMPGPLATNGDIVSAPTNYGEYQLVIQRTIEHFSKERGIDGVIYEVWNEPDLFGGWKVYGDKNYLNLYAAAARGADVAANSGARPFLFGGPATTALYENWMVALMKMVEEQNLRLDFLSWHRYDREIDVYTNDIAKLDEYIATHPRFSNVELHITEWGHDPKNDAGFDGSYGAAHTAAVSMELAGRVRRSFVFEIEDGKDPGGQEYWGRWGLLTHHDFGSKPKPRYRALQMLDEVGDQRLSLTGKGSWVKGIAGLDEGDVTVMLANYDPSARHNEIVPVTFTNLEARNFLFSQRFLDGTQRQEEIATTEAELKVEVPMGANSVVFLRLQSQ